MKIINTVYGPYNSDTRIVFMLFNLAIQKAFLVSVQRNFDMCAFNHVRATAIWENYAKKHEHVKFHARDIRG